jgi:hypothetical protein
MFETLIIYIIKNNNVHHHCIDIVNSCRNYDERRSAAKTLVTRRFPVGPTKAESGASRDEPSPRKDRNTPRRKQDTERERERESLPASLIALTLPARRRRRASRDGPRLRRSPPSSPFPLPLLPALDPNPTRKIAENRPVLFF